MLVGAANGASVSPTLVGAAVVGILLGASDGLLDGTTLGMPLGDALGILLGAADGLLDG